MVNKPLVRPAISGGGTWPGGGRLTSHNNGILTPESTKKNTPTKHIHPKNPPNGPGFS